MHSTDTPERKSAEQLHKELHQTGFSKAIAQALLASARHERATRFEGISYPQLAQRSGRRGYRRWDFDDNTLIEVGERYGWQKVFLKNHSTRQPYLVGIYKEIQGKHVLLTVHRSKRLGFKAVYAKHREVLAAPNPKQSKILGNSIKRVLKNIIGIDIDELDYWQIMTDNAEEPEWILLGRTYQNEEELFYERELIGIYGLQTKKTVQELPVSVEDLDEEEGLGFNFG